jgi:hypothetical protein
MYEVLITETANSTNSTGVAVAPRIPVDEMAQKYQNEEEANKVYKNLFYNKVTKKSGQYLYKANQYFSTVAASDVNNKIGDGTVIPGDTTVIDTYKSKKEVHLDLNFKLTNNRKIMDDYGEAMHHVSRPICTLEEYIKFIKGKGTGPFKRVGDVTAYKQIKAYAPGADAHIEPTIDDQWTNTANLRRDWVTRLDNYRTNVYAKRTVS